MNLKKAIEITDRHVNLHFDAPRAELDEASRLLLEAGKREQRYRKVVGKRLTQLLPGETED